MVEHRRKRSLPGRGRRPDGEPKSAPSSLRATLASIRSAWGRTLTERYSRGRRRINWVTKPHKDEQYHQALRKSLNKYLGLSDDKIASTFTERCELHPTIREDGTIKEVRHLRYADLRAYADIVNIPTGMLLLYSHILGDEYSSFFDLSEKSQDEILNINSKKIFTFTEKVMKCMEETQKRLSESNPALLILDESPSNIGKEEPDYWGDIQLLEKWSEIFTENK